jgi:Phytanoyl-CoA dioxygenase (PhyH)
MGYLSQGDLDHFMEHGYVIIHDCFNDRQTEWMLRDIWTRLNVSLQDQSQWNGKVHLPNHRETAVANFAPKAWGAICELLGGEEKIGEKGRCWSDSIIANFGGNNFTEESYPRSPFELDNWHVDGDYFLHFLDSPEQALLVIPIFSEEIKKKGGGTFIAPESISIVAKILAQNPKGLEPESFDFKGIAKQCSSFVELTGRAGDVILLHPLMLHSAAPNLLKIPRFITNPPVDIKEPFRFDKPYEELSIVERKTLKSLGVEAPYNFKAESDRVIYDYNTRTKHFEVLMESETERLNTIGHLQSFLEPFCN